MKSENEKANDEKEIFLIWSFRKLYDQQFPRAVSCFKLISIKERIEDLKEEHHTYNGWMIRIGYLLLAVFTFNLQFAEYVKVWSDSPYHHMVTWVTLGCGVWVLISAFVKFEMYYSRKITKYEMELCAGGFDHFKDTEELFLNLIQKFTWYDIKTPKELGDQLEKDVRFLVFLIKKGEVYPDDKGRNPLLKKLEDDLLWRMIGLISALGMMKVEEADNITITDNNYNTFKKKAVWLRKKLFDEVTI